MLHKTRVAQKFQNFIILQVRQEAMKIINEKDCGGNTALSKVSKHEIFLLPVDTKILPELFLSKIYLIIILIKFQAFFGKKYECAKSLLNQNAMIDDQTHIDTDGSEANDKSKEMIEDEIQKRVSRNYTISKITIITTFF